MELQSTFENLPRSCLNSIVPTVLIVPNGSGSLLLLFSADYYGWYITFLIAAAVVFGKSARIMKLLLL